jgi:cytochrome c-type biogenesis protein CcmH/NrfG
VALAQGGDLQASAARLAAITRATPYYAEPWLMLGAVRERQENAAGAVEAYRAFLARAPRDHRRTGFARERIRELDPTSTAGTR